jgi:hypothetical protein
MISVRFYTDRRQLEVELLPGTNGKIRDGSGHGFQTLDEARKYVEESAAEQIAAAQIVREEYEKSLQPKAATQEELIELLTLLGEI